MCVILTVALKSREEQSRGLIAKAEIQGGKE
jgi:hypothetical protein